MSEQRVIMCEYANDSDISSGGYFELWTSLSGKVQPKVELFADHVVEGLEQTLTRVSEEYKTSAALQTRNIKTDLPLSHALSLSTVVLSRGWWCSKRAQRHRTESVWITSQGYYHCLLPHISLLHSLSLTLPSPGQVLINAWHSIHCWEAKKPYLNKINVH